MINSISAGELSRIFTVRTQPEFMLFLGAGASASSGIPTASEMTWMFKREIFCSENNVSPANFKDLSVESVREKLQRHIEKQSWYKSIDPGNEYSRLFEIAWKDNTDRREFIQRCVREASPSIGYKFLGKLIEDSRITNILTTNFDDLIERGLPEHNNSILIISPESESRLEEVKISPPIPQLFKLHGDFRYDKLQNTSNEVQELNQKMQERLLDFFREYGVIFVGYSGRDQSVLEMLRKAVEDERSFRKGFYWCVIKDGEPSSAIREIIKTLKDTGRQADFVRIVSFDEFLYLLYKQCGLKSDAIDTIAKERFEQRRPFTYSTGENKSGQIIKLNSIQIREYPTTLYQFETDLRDWEDLQALVNGQNIVAALYKDHVIAVGSRPLIEATFDGHINNDISTFHILPGHLARNQGFVFYIFHKLINSSLTEQKSLKQLGNRNFYLLPNGNSTYSFKDKESNETIRVNLSERKYLKDTTCCAHPAFSYQLQFHDNELYFVLKPEVVLTSNGKDLLVSPNKKIICNEITSKRYNKALNDQLLFWLDYLSDDNGNIELTYPPDVSIPLVKFSLGQNYAYSCYGDS
jgi:NAD-dependent SIR2 family protein deacetylase